MNKNRVEIKKVETGYRYCTYIDHFKIINQEENPDIDGRILSEDNFSINQKTTCKKCMSSICNKLNKEKREKINQRKKEEGLIQLEKERILDKGVRMIKYEIAREKDTDEKCRLLAEFIEIGHNNLLQVEEQLMEDDNFLKKEFEEKIKVIEEGNIDLKQEMKILKGENIILKEEIANLKDTLNKLIEKLNI